MTNSEYMQNLLSLCTDKQSDLFYRMYPKGPNKNQLKRAIQQIECTLKDLNVMKSDLSDVKKAAKTAQDKTESELIDLQGILRYTEDALSEANESIERLSNPINVENKEIQDRLSLLDSLERGGVDNWEFYDVATED